MSRISSSIIILLVFLMMVTPPPSFTARWASPGVARLSWSQSSRGCLYRESAIGERVYLGCFDGTGSAVLVLGGPQTDASYRPATHDVYVLDQDGVIERAELRGVVYVAVARR